MGIVITNLGTGATTVTIGAGGVPAGTQIVVCACDNNGITGGASVADSAGNTYLSLTGSTLFSPFVDIFRARTGLALTNGQTITYTPSANATASNIAAFYLTGARNVPGQANATAHGTSASPSVTSGTPDDVGFLFVGAVVGSTAISSFTQDSTNAAWGSPPGQVSLLLPAFGGGTVINNNKSSSTYNPAFGTSDNWGAVIAAIKPDFTDYGSRAMMMS